jgi:hypothetical protein
MSTPTLGIMMRPSSITGSLALMSAGGVIGCVCWIGGGVVVEVVDVVDVVVVVVVVVGRVVDVVEVVVLVVVGGSVVDVVEVLVVDVVVGAAVVVTVVIAASAVPSPPAPAHELSSNVPATADATSARYARRADASEEPPFPRANIGTIMSLNHRPSPLIA